MVNTFCLLLTEVGASELEFPFWSIEAIDATLDRLVVEDKAIAIMQDQNFEKELEWYKSLGYNVMWSPSGERFEGMRNITIKNRLI